jgi:bacterioferritin
MPDPKSQEVEVSRDRLAELLNEDLAREYQAIIAYVVYSQVLSGAQYMDIAAQRLENTPWPNRSARSSSRSKTIKSIWPPLSAKKFRT